MQRDDLLPGVPGYVCNPTMLTEPTDTLSTTVRDTLLLLTSMDNVNLLCEKQMSVVLGKSLLAQSAASVNSRSHNAMLC